MVLKFPFDYVFSFRQKRIFCTKDLKKGKSGNAAVTQSCSFLEEITLAVAWKVD